MPSGKGFDRIFNSLKPLVVDEATLGVDWFVQEHVPALCRVANQYQVAITGRATGKLSIDRIRNGYPTKGHDILHKSLKVSSLSGLAKDQRPIAVQIYPGDGPLIPDRWGSSIQALTGAKLVTFIAELDIDGLVGWWRPRLDEQGVPYPDGCASTGRKRGDCIPIGVFTVYSGCEYINDVASPGGCGLSFADIENATAVADAYTGDYDLHDLIFASGPLAGYRLPSSIDELTRKELFSLPAVKGAYSDLASGTTMPKGGAHDDLGKYYGDCSSYVPELQLICRINEEVKRHTSCRTKDLAPSHCSLIRHGPQATYVNYAEVAKETLIPSLAVFDENVVAIQPLGEDRCRYFLLNHDNKRAEDIVDFYRFLAKSSNFKKGQGPHPLVLASLQAKTKAALKALNWRVASKGEKMMTASFLELTNNIADELNSFVKATAANRSCTQCGPAAPARGQKPACVDACKKMMLQCRRLLEMQESWSILSPRGDRITDKTLKTRFQQAQKTHKKLTNLDKSLSQCGVYRRRGSR